MYFGKVTWSDRVWGGGWVRGDTEGRSNNPLETWLRTCPKTKARHPEHWESAS